MLAVHAHAMCQLTVAKVRKVYNKVDSKSIAKQVRAHSTVTALNLNIVVWLAKQGSELWVISLAAGTSLAAQLEYLSRLLCMEVNCGLFPLQLGFSLQIGLNICLVCRAGK